MTGRRMAMYKHWQFDLGTEAMTAVDLMSDVLFNWLTGLMPD